MVVELGHYALILALMLAAAQAFFGLAGPALKRERWLAVVPSAACGQFVFVALAVGVLVHAFVNNDFSVRYVAETSNSVLPLFYRVTALWGAHEGSMLLWILVLSLWTMALVAQHAPSAAVLRRARSWRTRHHQLLFPAVHARNLQSLRAPDSRGARRQ